MNYNYRTPLNPASSEQQLMIKQQRRMAHTKLAQDFCQLLNSPNSPNLHWNSTISDLMEVVLLVFQEGNIVNKTGCPCSFRDMATEICNKLHVKQPRYARRCANQATQRKGVRQCSFLDRYLFTMTNNNGDSLLNQYVGR